MSPHGNAESSNESFDSDTSARLDVSNVSLASEERSKWPPVSISRPTDWSQKDVNQWHQKNTQWPAIPELQVEQAHSWPVMERNGDRFLENLIHNSSANQELPPPPKPDSPTDVSLRNDFNFDQR